MKTVEYRVRPVTRYIVTKFSSECTISEVHGTLMATSGNCGSEVCGEFDREDTAERITLALARAEAGTDELRAFAANGQEMSLAVPEPAI